MKNEYVVHDPLNDWLIKNKERLYTEFGINLSEDKDQWIIDVLEEVYELGIGEENEFWRLHGHNT